MNGSRLQESVEMIQNAIQTIEGKLSTLSRVVSDASFQQSVAQELLHEVGTRVRFDS